MTVYAVQRIVDGQIVAESLVDDEFQEKPAKTAKGRGKARQGLNVVKWTDKLETARAPENIEVPE